MRVTSPSSIGHRHGGPLLLLRSAVFCEQKVDNVCRFVLLLAQMCSLAISLYCRLMSIGVSADRAGDGLFMASLMRAIIQKSLRTRDKVYKEDETMVQEKNSFQRQRDRDVANLLPAPPVVASESQEGWRSATPVHRGHNSSDDSLQLMALSRALNPSSLIGESSGK